MMCQSRFEILNLVSNHVIIIEDLRFSIKTILQLMIWISRIKIGTLKPLYFLNMKAHGELRIPLLSLYPLDVRKS